MCFSICDKSSKKKTVAKEQKKIVKTTTFNIPNYLPEHIINNFPKFIIDNCEIIVDNNKDSFAYKFYYKLYDKNNKCHYFMKISLPHSKICNEYNAYEKINNTHNNIIKIVYKYTDARYTIIITPWYEYDLFYVIEHFVLSEIQIKVIFIKILDALYFLFKKGILMTDIKLENIMIDCDLNPMIVDFDMYIDIQPEHEYDDYTLKHVLCTRCYKAPETIAFLQYSHKTISWKLGIMLFVMIDKKLNPFNVRQFEIMVRYLPSVRMNYEAYRQYIYKVSWNAVEYNAELDDLIKKLLDPNPATRISMEEIMVHKWFKTSLTNA